jgi:small-conductance mechanosensitive channel
MVMAWVLQSDTWMVMADRARVQLHAAALSTVDFLFALVVLLIGWLVARLVSAVAVPILRTLRFNDGVRSLLGVPTDASSRHEPVRLAAWLIFWTILLISLLLAMDVLGFNLTGAVSDRLRDVLPRILVATVMLVIGVIVAIVLGSVTRRLFEGAGLRSSRFRGQLVTAVLTVFAVLLALEQLGLAAQFILTIMMIAIGAIGLALGLAFGLGCRDLARDFVVEYLRSLDRDGPQRPS